MYVSMNESLKCDILNTYYLIFVSVLSGPSGELINLLVSISICKFQQQN
jgi:hypothetical protein